MKLDAFMGVRVPAGVYAAIEAEARRKRVSLSDVIRSALVSAVITEKSGASKELN